MEYPEVYHFINLMNKTGIVFCLKCSIKEGFIMFIIESFHLEHLTVLIQLES